jgi:hypothetical protein
MNKHSIHSKLMSRHQNARENCDRDIYNFEKWVKVKIFGNDRNEGTFDHGKVRADEIRVVLASFRFPVQCLQFCLWFLYGCESLFLPLMEEYRLNVFDNWACGEYLDRQEDRMTGGF